MSNKTKSAAIKNFSRIFNTRINKELVPNKKVLTAMALSIGAIFSTQTNAQFDYDSSNNAYFLDAESFLKEQKSIQKGSKSTKSMEDMLRIKAIEDYAKNIAIQASIRSNIQMINNTIKSNARNLDAIYDFQPLMIQGMVVPPVVTEANSLYNQSGKMQVRLTDRLYEIQRQAYISSNPPNWRDYLLFPSDQDAYHDYIYLTVGLKPKGSIETKAWERATKEGWEIGKKQANTILTEAMDRLNRDYTGMVRFHMLAVQGKLDMPAMTTYELSDNTDGIRMLMGERLLQITSLPQFKKANSETLLPIANHSNFDGYLPEGSAHAIHDGQLALVNDNAVIKQTFKARNNVGIIDTPPLMPEPTYTSDVVNPVEKDSVNSQSNTDENTNTSDMNLPENDVNDESNVIKILQDERQRELEKLLEWTSRS